MAGTEIAALFAKISADVSDFNRAMKSVDDDLNGFQRGMAGLSSAVGTGLKVAAGAAVAAVGALGAGIVSATLAAADMEQGIANIAASMQLTSGETEELKGLIMDLGLDPKLKVTATEAAQAIEVLGTAGLTMTEILDGAARSTVLLANSTGADFAQAGGIASDVMAQFNIKAADMAAAVDQITGVTVASKFTINDYELALAQAGGVAASVGISFEDFNAVIAATAPSFASGSDAGTSFKTFTQRLVPASKAAEDAMRALGLITADGANQFFDASGQMKDMNEIAELLEGAFGGLSEAQKIEAASTIFGTDAMRTAFALAKGGGETIDEMKRIIGNTSAEDAAATRMDTLRGAWEIFTGVVETLSLGIGDKFLPVAQRVIEWATGMAQQYGPRVIEWAGKLADAVRDVTDWITGWIETGDALNELLYDLPRPLADFVQWVDRAWKAVKDFIDPIVDIIAEFVDWEDVLIAVGIVIAGTLLAALASAAAAIAPVVVAFAALTTAVAAGRRAWENDWLGIRTATLQAGDYLKERFSNLVGAVQQFGGDALAELGQWVQGNDTDFKAVGRIWDEAKSTARTLYMDLGKFVSENYPKWRDALMPYAESVWETFAEKFPEAAEILRGAWAKLQTNWEQLVSAFTKASAAISALWAKLTDDTTTEFSTMERIIKNVMEIITTAIDVALNTITNVFSLVLNIIAGDWKAAWQDVKDIAGDLWNGIVTLIRNALDSILALFGIADWERKGADIISGLWSGVRNMWYSFTGWFRDRWDDLTHNFKSFFGIHSPSTLFESFGMSMGQGLQRGLESSTANVLNTMDSLSSGILSRANALGVSLDGSIATIASKITALGNYQTAVAGIATDPGVQSQVGDAHAAAANQNNYNTAPQGLNLASYGYINPMSEVGQLATEFAKGVASFVGAIASVNGGVIPSAFETQAYTDAANTLLDNRTDKDSDLVQAIYTLIATLKNAPQQGQKTEFNLTAAPGQSGNTYTDLANLIQYLSVLNAS